jgi:protein tyrosine phosphatase (PTP) superfamily phosphohydrolase (DUF442 family)
MPQVKEIDSCRDVESRGGFPFIASSWNIVAPSTIDKARTRNAISGLAMKRIQVGFPGGIEVMRSLFLIAVSGIAFATGCQQTCCLNKPDCRPKPFQPSAPSGPYLLPPSNLPTTPAPTGAVIPSVAPSNYPPPVLGPIAPGPSLKPPPEVLFPDPLPGGPSSRGISPADRGQPVLQSPTKPSTTPEPPIVPSVMTGIPGFTKLPDGLASGRKPDIDGFASLKQAGYRTIVYLHPAGTDVSAIRELAGKRELKFIPIETTPEKLTTALEEFNAALADRALRSAYVFDDDGVRAGAMWYLHFKTAKSMNEDAARVRAKPLGLTDRGEEAQAFELAIQRFLSSR